MSPCTATDRYGRMRIIGPAGAGDHRDLYRENVDDRRARRLAGVVGETPLLPPLHRPGPHRRTGGPAPDGERTVPGRTRQTRVGRRTGVGRLHRARHRRRAWRSRGRHRHRQSREGVHPPRRRDAGRRPRPLREGGAPDRRDRGLAARPRHLASAAESAVVRTGITLVRPPCPPPHHRRDRPARRARRHHQEALDGSKSMG